MISQTEQKKLASLTAIDTLLTENLLHSGMKLGLGTGSTAMYAVEAIASKIKDGTLSDIKAVATSFQTTIACEELGIPVFSLNSPQINGELDFTIDGADEIDPQRNLIKGGGAALLLEKIVAYNSAQYYIIADESKMVKSLGTKFPLPIEIIPEARVSVQKILEKDFSAKTTLRQGVKKCGPVITDNGNQILDCLWEQPVSPTKLEQQLKSIVGVVEVGFFTKRTPRIFVGYQDGSVFDSNHE